VQENLDLYADLHGVSREQRRGRYARLLEMTDLGRFTARPAGKLSGGMKQKLGLACTLVRSPELLLLDEPTVGVDPLSRRELWQIVRQLVDDERLSVIVSTTYLDEAERCARVFVLHEGRLLAQGRPEDIRRPARGLCFVAPPPPGEPARLLQARLLDDTARIIDAVPQGGEVRVIRRQAERGRLRSSRGTPWPGGRSRPGWKTASWCCCGKASRRPVRRRRCPRCARKPPAAKPSSRSATWCASSAISSPWTAPASR